ncbi:transcriptional regulator [Anaerobacillus alkalidiazotrophicus]|uniref:Transcriptional regulator n=1 Tax=Anaerobacillus alkalidiazotrophicus TaxID=472963 RepID=A0A1S2LVE6_9BACI|nr:helix-turn-helix transcriptional regulator [Anaerobacillus alkalidiazotrophicus]OIJ16502.1 transcriptional regulator [Anaerobacillus alkalidiazotrophicus]
MTLLEYLRKEMGMSQVQLSKKISVNPTAITQIERGNRKSWPKLRKQLSQVFGVDENLLFDSDGWPRKINVDF